MGSKSAKKRSAPINQVPNKKRKVAQNASASKSKGKEKAFDRPTIPIPGLENDDEAGGVEEGLDMLEDFGGAEAFLTRLDSKGIARSKKETERLHRLNRPERKDAPVDDLPSLNDSGSEDDMEDWSSGIDEDDLSDVSLPSANGGSSDPDSDVEMPYEAAPRKHRPSWDSENKKRPEVQRLPIKLADGVVQKTGVKKGVTFADSDATSESEEEEEDIPEPEPVRKEDVSTGARFGRPAIVDILNTRSRKARIEAAKEQIAGICQDIVADPENNLGLLRRLHTFSLATVTSPSQEEPVQNDAVIRKLAILSQLAVFKDIVPGYRIRSLTDKEKAEKVSQMVARTRDWEQGLVGVYQTYLRGLEAELKGKNDLSEVALHCVCSLAAEVTHFNFRQNLFGCIVARLSKKSWDESSALCQSTLIKILKADVTGEPSLEIVRLLNRMIKERKFHVHPNTLFCLIHLRLKTELNVRASESKADKDGDSTNSKKFSKNRAAARRAKGKKTDTPHLSKKQQKLLKEKKEIDRDMREAEAEVDKEERAVTQTETLKLLFVLYFRILKNPTPTPLLPAALRGIAKFAHLVNIDFFKDLMTVLKGLIVREDFEQEPTTSNVAQEEIINHRLLCVVTAFDLLTGQGEALNIDLSDFITQLYSLILPLSAYTAIDKPTSSSPTTTTADMLFRALNAAFSRTPGTAISAAFSKRLLISSLQWPSSTVLQVIEFIRVLVVKDTKLEGMLSTEEDRAFDGVYRPELDDPQLCNALASSFFELKLLQERHVDPAVRDAAGKLSGFSR